MRDLYIPRTKDDMRAEALQGLGIDDELLSDDILIDLSGPDGWRYEKPELFAEDEQKFVGLLRAQDAEGIGRFILNNIERHIEVNQ